MELHLTNLVPDQIVKALCNTLIHSLWLGLILAAVTGVTIVLTKKASAALRYNLMIGYLLLFSAAIVFTFAVHLHFSQVKPTAPVVVIEHAPATHLTTVKEHPADSPSNIVSNCISFFNLHSDTIVLIWFLIICARCVQLTAGLYTIYHIKRTKVLSAGAFWDSRANELANQLGIKRTVNILQSGIAKLPMVLGHFKPVILIPIGLLTALSTEEVESILVHELAHIHRRDYLVNILQNLLEIIFFFNPAVLWVSALIKTERENCCDDIVVAQTDSKVSYIKALVSCQEYQSTIPAYAMGLGGNSNHFLQRVKRMLSNSNQTLNKVEKMVLTICLISAVLLTAAFSGAEKGHASIKSKSVNSLIKTAKTDSLIRTATTKGDTGTMGNGKLKIYKNSEVAEGTVLRFTKKVKHELYLIYLIKKNGVLYQYTALDNGDKTKYYVNGNPVSNDKYAEYHDLFERMMSEADASAPKSPARPGELQHNGGTGEIVDSADINARDHIRFEQSQNLSNVNKVLDSIKRANRAKGLGSMRGNPGKLTGSLSQLDTQRAMAAYKLAMLDSTGQGWRKMPIKPKSYPYKYKTAYKPYDNKAYPNEQKEPVEPKIADVAGQAQVAKPAQPAAVAKAYGAYHSAPGAPPSPVNTVGDGITEQLINDHLIKDKNNYTFKITNDELYIDGVKQSDELHKKIIEKYLKPGDEINYTRTNTTKN